MIASDSPLRRLPAGIEPKQALFLDGIRHAAEIADLALRRLAATLTALALSQGDETQKKDYTAPFLDAWAFVDAIDRLRSLLHLLPGASRVPRTDGGPPFHEFTQTLRDVRNVGDHLATRADYVVARQGAALGQLSWITVKDPDAGLLLSCAIVPGTIVDRTNIPLPNPASFEALAIPTDRITLTAGEHSVCFNDVMPEVERVVRALEEELARWMKHTNNEGKAAGSDMLFVATLALDVGPE